MATKTTIETDSAVATHSAWFVRKTQVTCGPAACLIMFANIYDKDPDADEGGVIALSKMYPDAWTQQKGANIDNLAKVMGQMMMRVEVKRFTGGLADIKLASPHAGRPKKTGPRVFLQWGRWPPASSSVISLSWALHAPPATLTRCSIPISGCRKCPGCRSIIPSTDEPDQPSLQFTGAVALLL